MTETYTKLFTSITVSTIWQEPMETRLTWITLLAMADQNGDVYAAVPGLARMANVPLDKVEAALACLLAPDPYSRSKQHDGRRIEEIDGGWRLLNHAKFHAMRMEAERAAYKREWDRKNRPSGSARPQSDTNPTKSDISPTQSDTPTIPDRPDPPDQTRLLPARAESKSKALSRSVGTKPIIGADLDFSSWPERPSDDVLRDWLQMRKKRKADVTPTVLKTFGKHLHRAKAMGWTVDDVLAKCCSRNWTGFEADWLEGAAGRMSNNNGKPSAAASFHGKVYKGTAEEDLPPELRSPRQGTL